MRTLEQISANYKTDKGESYHGYLKVYERYFEKYKDSLTNFLEIGLWEGESIKMWREYFSTGTIVGADIMDLSHIKLPKNTQVHVCDQSNRDDLKKLVESSFDNFDIVIDDGGHWQHEQQITLGFMFPYLNSGGMFVIEDLHTSNNPHYTRQGDVATLDMLKEWKDTGNLISNCMTEAEIQYLKENISEIHIEKCYISDIAFLIKK